MISRQHALNSYIIFFEQMKREDLVRLPEFFADQARFKDPFNDVTGIEQINKVFHHMFEVLDTPKFIIYEAVLESDVAYIKWNFTGASNAKQLKLVGLSRVVFNDRGLVSEHVDYWDASEQFYMKLPVIGSILRFIRNKAAN
ncbi:MAG: nuclear transport factor 2 family protein [Methylophagaceae bacterium]